jgi:RNA polymerase sigma factor FliA
MLKAGLATKVAESDLCMADEQIQQKKKGKIPARHAPLVQHCVRHIKSRTHAKKTGAHTLQSDKEEIFGRYEKLIRYIASRIASRLPRHIEIHDMINSGVLGLLDAIEKFDATKGVKFETYAEYRIKGAMLDSLRAMDWVPRSIRKVASMLETTSSDLEKKFGRPATNEEVAKAMDVGAERFYKIMNRISHISTISLEQDQHNSSSSHSLLDRIVDENHLKPSDRLDNEELNGMISGNIEHLPEKERTVISLYYFNELTMKEIGRQLKLTESRVSQIHTKAVGRLRGKLRKQNYC